MDELKTPFYLINYILRSEGRVRSLKQYEISECPLANGKFGDIYRARIAHTNVEVTLKYINPRLLLEGENERWNLVNYLKFMYFYLKSREEAGDRSYFLEPYGVTREFD